MNKVRWKKRAAVLAVAVFSVGAAQATPIIYEFVNNGEFDGTGIGTTMTRSNVTISTVDIVGIDGSRASEGTNHVTSINSNGSLGINSVGTDSSTNFEELEAWEFQFDTDVYLTSIELNSMADGNYFYISSLDAEFDTITVGPEEDVALSLGSTFVTAGKTLQISFSSTTGDTSRITNLVVDTIPEPASIGLLGACAVGAFVIRRFRM